MNLVDKVDNLNAPCPTCEHGVLSLATPAQNFGSIYCDRCGAAHPRHKPLPKKVDIMDMEGQSCYACCQGVFGVQYHHITSNSVLHCNHCQTMTEKYKEIMK